ncbi:unnamed protein product [Didymodactylos carnosus]|uniref:Ubiquitin-like domain-containing protein n=1 Tax=Didymodactylos carnosus TaxID=1234261 RepID=A0A8S2GV08_9BILA|nr:unnamed protein product [Didymodactylos carnosus]CAF3564961.1 unnamed protein product [Didymodactylos carnosus]
MFEFTLKFLTGESRKYEVDESESVRQFKERLRDELNIPIERQRLIFQGKVLQDETKLIDSNIQNKTVHFVERAEPPPPQNTNNGFGGVASGTADMSQSMLDEVNETTSVFINAFPGSMNLNSNDVQSLVQNLLNDLGDVGRQARVNTTMTSDGQGVDIQIDFGNVAQYLQQHELRERFRSIGRMMTRLRSRLDRLEQLIESNFRLPTSTAENSEQQNQTNDADASTSSSTGPEDITSEMDTDDSQTSTPQTNAQSTTASNEASAPVTTVDLEEPLETRAIHLGEPTNLGSPNMMGPVHNATATDQNMSAVHRLPRLNSRRPTAVATARIMGPVSFGAGQMGFRPQTPQGGVHFHPASMGVRQVPETVPNNAEQSSSTPLTSTMPATASGMQPMTFNLGVPWTFVEMGPTGITLNQVSAQVVADVQTSDGTSSMPTEIPHLTNLSGMPNLNNLPGMANLNNLPGMANLNNLPGMANLNNLPGMANLNNLPGMPNLSNLPANATVIMGQRATDANGQPGPIQINGGAFDNNFAASIAQRVQEHFAQLAGQTAAGVASGSTNVSFSTQIPSNDNNQSLNAAASTSATNERSQAHARYVPSGTLTVNPLTGRLVLDGSSRSRSADSRPASSSSATTQSPTGSPSQQATNFTMMTSHDNPLQGRMMIPGQRTTILRKCILFFYD